MTHHGTHGTHALQRRSTLLKQLAKADVLLIDDFVLASFADQHKRDLLEILYDRYDKRSTIITSQLPIEDWQAATRISATRRLLMPSWIGSCTTPTDSL